MDTTQIILLSIASIIVLFVIIYFIANFFKHRQDVSNVVEIESQREEEFPKIQEDEIEDIEESPADIHSFMMISVHPKPNKVFSDYSFLQTMGSVGLIYGEHKIFHYDVKTDIGTQRLFSVAQLNKPGTFDIDHVETINCRGLLLFIDLRACRKQTLALDCMLETAYQLVEDLDGIMFEGYNIPWQEDTPRALTQKLEQYQKNLVGVVDEVTY